MLTKKKGSLWFFSLSRGQEQEGCEFFFFGSWFTVCVCVWQTHNFSPTRLSLVCALVCLFRQLDAKSKIKKTCLRRQQSPRTILHRTELFFFFLMVLVTLTHFPWPPTHNTRQHTKKRKNNTTKLYIIKKKHPGSFPATHLPAKQQNKTKNTKQREGERRG